MLGSDAPDALLTLTASRPELFPRQDVDEMKALRERLAALGHDVGELDGTFGAGTHAAVQKQLVRLGHPADGWPIRDLLDAL